MNRIARQMLPGVISNPPKTSSMPTSTVTTPSHTRAARAPVSSHSASARITQPPICNVYLNTSVPARGRPASGCDQSMRYPQNSMITAAKPAQSAVDRTRRFLSAGSMWGMFYLLAQLA